MDGPGQRRQPGRLSRLVPGGRAGRIAGIVGLALVLGLVTWFVWPSGHTTPTGQQSPTTGSTASSASPPGSPSGSATPSLSASPSAARSTTLPPPPRASGAKPGPGNTGVPPGTALTVVNGDQTYSTAGQVISGLDIHGFVQVTAKNVTIRNSIIRGGPNPKCNSSVLWIANGASASVTDTEIAPSNANACLDGVWATSATLTRMNIHGSVDGVKAYDNVTIVDSYIHDLAYFSSDPNQNGGPTHNDAVQTYEGNQHIVIRHNTFDLSTSQDPNATYQLTQDGGKVATDIHIDSNWLDGGGCTLNFSHKGGPTPMTGIYVTNNRFGRHSYYNCPILISTQTVLSQNAGNVWDDTGAPIPKPQQHD
jgi:hypothetical protein